MYHLHGYSFYVVGARQFDRSMSLKEIEDLDKQDLLFTRNLECAPLKDTVIVAKHSAVAIRFKANNPGRLFFRSTLSDPHRSICLLRLIETIFSLPCRILAAARRTRSGMDSWVGPDPESWRNQRHVSTAVRFSQVWIFCWS